MKKSISYYLTALLSLSMSLGVVCSGAHSKDVLMYASTPNRALLEAFRKQVADDASQLQTNTKVSAELHNHIEKQTLKTMVKTVSDQAPQADMRSLKRVKPVVVKVRKPRRLAGLASLLHLFAHAH
ncbi:MAG TPA: hypothetical protein VFZ48_04645 [Candidatus Saccharimonadales bacterium]